MEITNYKGKDYLCKTYPDRITLYSLHYVDESFNFNNYATKEDYSVFSAQ